MANYWEDPGKQNYPRNPNAPRPIPQTPPELVAAIRAAGQKPTEAQIQAALDFMDRQDPTGLAWKNGAGAFGDRTYQQQELANNDIRNNQFAQTGDPAWLGPPKSGAGSPFLQQLSQGLSGGPDSAIGGILGAFGNVAQSVIQAANQANAQAGDSFDPMDMLSQLRKQYGDYKYTGPSAETMVGREFDPQFAALKQIEQGTQNRYKTNSQQMQGLYQALAGEVLKGRDQDAAAYRQATNDINTSYGQGQQAVTNNMNQATGEMGKQLALLGQNEAAAPVFQEKQKLLSNQLGQLASAQGNAAALNTQLGANAYAADTANYGTTRQAGLNAQADLAGQLEQLMQQYGTQRLGLEAGRGQALNQYGMNIQKLIQEGTAGQNSAINDAFKTAMSSRDTELDREIKRGSLDLDRKRLEMQMANAGSSGQSLNPYDALLKRSSEVNTNPQEAANDAEVLFQTYMGDVNAPNIKVLMDMVEENNPGWLALPGNKALAYDYFSKVLSGNKR